MFLVFRLGPCIHEYTVNAMTFVFFHPIFTASKHRQREKNKMISRNGRAVHGRYSTLGLPTEHQPWQARSKLLCSFFGRTQVTCLINGLAISRADSDVVVGSHSLRSATHNEIQYRASTRVEESHGASV